MAEKTDEEKFEERLKKYEKIIFGNKMENRTAESNKTTETNRASEADGTSETNETAKTNGTTETNETTESNETTGTNGTTGDDKGSASTEEDKRYEKAYDTALKTRELEINLFWKRGTFFWAFITVAFVGYWSVFDKAMSSATCNTCCNVACEAVCCISKISQIAPYYKVALCVISSVIFLFCFIFHLSIRGSKQWQENWEEHIDYLEEKNTGSLFKSFFIKKGGWLNFLEVYDFSVSKLANWVSVIMTVATGFLCLATYILCCDVCLKFFEKHSKLISNITIVVLLLVTLGLVFVIYRSSKGNPDALKTLKEQEKKEKKDKKDQWSLYSRRTGNLEKL